MRAELAAAVMLLTRLPVAWLASAEPAGMAASVWAYPLAGAVVGGIGGAAVTLAARAGLPAPLCAIWALAAQLLATGALHEDGLADTADGLGGGRTRARKLEIMRDSRIGSFGALALMLSLATRVAALSVIARPCAALIASGALSRAAMVLVLLALRPARPDGLAASLADLSPIRAALALALALAIAFAALPPPAALRAAAGALAAALSVAWLARRQVGGYTGDILGATAVGAECVALTLLSAPSL